MRFKPKYRTQLLECLAEAGLSEDEARLIADHRVPTPKVMDGEFKVSAADGEAEVIVYDVIGLDPWTGEGVTAQKIREQLDSAGQLDKIHVRIASPGGDAFEGLNIYNMFLRHQADVIVHIDSLAASSASVIAMAGDEVMMAESSEMMIHDAWGVTIGNQADHIKVAAILDKLDSQLAQTYAKKSGKKAATFRTMMDDETWLTPPEALALKLADRIDPEMRAAACVFDFGSMFDRPARAKPAPQPPAPEPSLRETTINLKHDLYKMRGMAARKG